MSDNLAANAESWNEHMEPQEPSVLERLKDWKVEYLRLASGSPTDNYISPMAAKKVAEELADAIVEIENTRNLLKLSLDALKLHQLEFEIRYQYTEADQAPDDELPDVGDGVC